MEMLSALSKRRNDTPHGAHKGNALTSDDVERSGTGINKQPGENAAATSANIWHIAEFLRLQPCKVERALETQSHAMASASGKTHSVYSQAIRKRHDALIRYLVGRHCATWRGKIVQT